MAGRIHTLLIHHEDEELEWKFDEDYSNYMGLCSALASELACEEDFAGKRTLNISIHAVVEGRSDVINIENDASLMSMFGSNVDTANPIDVYVGFEEMDATVDHANQGRKRATIYELDDVPDSQNAMVLYEGSEQGEASKKKEIIEEQGEKGVGLDDIEDFEALVQDVNDAVADEEHTPVGDEEDAPIAAEEDNNVWLDDVEEDDTTWLNDVARDDPVAEDNVDAEASDSLSGSDESGDDPAWLDGEDEESGESDSLGSFLVDSSDAEHEVEPNLTEDQAINQGRRRYDTEDDEIGKGSSSRKRPSVRAPLPTPISIYDARGRVQFGLYQRFRNNKHFRECLVTFAVEQGFELQKIKSCRTRVTYKCAAAGCEWRIHASLSPCRLFMMVKTYKNQHLCQAVRNNKNASSGWISRVLAAEFLADPNMKLKSIKARLKERFGITGISKAKLFRARVMARGGNLDSHVEEFQKLRLYANMILHTNPGSLAIVKSEVSKVGDRPHFQRIFICLEACKWGFLEACRPVISIDGCHLKGPYGGVILSAISLEANLGYFPVAYAIVEIENRATWCWFLDLLKEAVGRDVEQNPWCIISDRQKGLVNAIQEVLPGCSHRSCCHHILQNFQKKFRQTGLGDFFWAAAKAPNVQEFLLAMNNIRQENSMAFEWLNMLDTRSWAFHAMERHVKCEHVTSNFVESFNAWIDEERYLPPITMLELIRSKIMDLIYTRLQIANRWKGALTPDVLGRVSVLDRVSRHAEVLRAGEYEFQVELNGIRVGVKLDAGKCDCGAWELREIPCVHALACINTIRADVVEYCSPYFRAETWKKTFSRVVHPIPSMHLWPAFEEDHLLQVPLCKRQPGRPKKHRNRAADETRHASSRALKVTCAICGESGHNRRGCPNNPSKKMKTSHTTQSPSQHPPSSTPNEEPLPQSQLSQL